MHPFGGTPVCPRCQKAVYAAEQVMGPGRKLYHKPCLSCAICKKRLDSFSLVEHEEEPYCKNCHVKNFGTRDLRAANLPHREAPPDSPPSPTKDSSRPLSPQTTANGERPSSPPPRSFWSGTAVSRQTTGSSVGVHRTGSMRATPVLRPTRALSPGGLRSPTAPSFGSFPPPEKEESPPAEPENPTKSADSTADVAMSSPVEPDAPQLPEKAESVRGGESEAEEEEVQGLLAESAPSSPERPKRTAVSQANGTPLRPTSTGASAAGASTPRAPNYNSFATLGRANTGGDSTPRASPVVSTPLGSRYGAVLGGSVSSHGTGTPSRWGGSASPSAPLCARCGKTAYFAEQVKAIGQTWHKGCLRCAECATSLAPGRLSEREGVPYCQRCYSRVHGPQGGGYALLGKAGG